MTKQEEMMLRAEGLRRLDEEGGFRAVDELLTDWRTCLGLPDGWADEAVAAAGLKGQVSEQFFLGMVLGAYLASGRVCPVPPIVTYAELMDPLWERHQQGAGKLNEHVLAYAAHMGSQMAESHAKYHEQHTKLPKRYISRMPGTARFAAYEAEPGSHLVSFPGDDSGEARAYAEHMLRRMASPNRPNPFQIDWSKVLTGKLREGK